MEFRSIVCRLVIINPSLPTLCRPSVACAAWSVSLLRDAAGGPGSCVLTSVPMTAASNLATADESDSVPRICRLILAIYEADLDNLQYVPVDPRSVVKQVNYDWMQGRGAKDLIYVDGQNKDIVLT